MVFDPPQRRRPFLRLVLPILIGVGVIAALVVSSFSEETRLELEYLETIDAQAAELARSGDALRDVVSRLQRIDRVEFVTVIEGVLEDLAVATEFVGEEPPVASLLSVRAQYRAALEIWTVGIEGFEAATLEAADQPDSNIVLDLMAEALAQLRAGDSFFSSLVVDMRRDDVPSPLTEFPLVVLSPAEGSLVSNSVAYIDSARSSNASLALRAGLAISQLASDPEWQVNPSDEVVVPATDQIVFSAVITNVGNIASEDEYVILTLAGGAEEVRMQAEVPSLEPNQQVAIPFEAVSVDPGTVYEVRATLAVTGPDSSGDDNTRAVQFTVSEDESGT